ncbi:CheR family methyltransferase [Microvirga sp. 2TAF3]|uniref:CheR family methyltransferase n=1 Tax=Microvirga sp. 2TAF3 TaxID=3233014 RepID=UPI003F9673F3
MVDFQNINLIHNSGCLGHSDIVFCSNVLIYFDAKSKRDVLNWIANVMSLDGASL